MATRVNRKNAATAAASSKEIVNTEKGAIKTEPGIDVQSKPSGATKSTSKSASIGKRLAKRNPTKKIVKKPIGIKLKAKAKKQLKVNPVSKALLQNTKTAENRKKLLRNGVKEIKPTKKRKQVKREIDDSPPVLEPIFPIEENLGTKKSPKKRGPKKSVKNSPGDLLDATKVKVEQEDDISSDFTDVSNNEIPTLSKQVRKPRAPRKPKPQNETLEDVMNDLSFLIKAEDIKKEVDSLSESGKSDTVSKPKKLTKRQRIELLKKKMIKKENIENTLSKLDSSDEKVIDMLDLNVKRVKKKSPLTKRRHSIEKFPISSVENTDGTQLSLFSHLPRSISPKSKRAAKGRQSVDGIPQRSNPYATRSDSPARILRNGKQRKLKSMGLLSGLESTAKKRRRLCSDQSGVDILGSKLSGYESDSSFSDLSSIHGTESNDVKELDLTKNLPSASSDTAHNGPTDNLGIIDTNSNLCKNFDLNKSTLKSEPMDCKEDIILPDKAALLDIMKQAFNDGSFKKTAKSNPKCATMTTTKFYGKPSVKSRGATANKTEKVETVVSESPCVSPLENTPVVPMESQESKCSPESSNKEVQDPAQVIFNQLEKNKQPEEILRLSDDVLNRLQEVMNQQEDALNQSDTVLKQSETLNQTNETLVQPETPDQPVDVSNQQVDVLDESVGVSDEPVDVSNQTADVSVQSVDMSNQTVDVSDQPEDVSNQTVVVSNQPVDVLDQQVDVSDQSVGVSEEPVHVSDQPMDILDPPMDVLNQPVDILDCPQKPVHQTDESQGVLTESASVVSHFEEKPFELVKPSSAPIENGTECEVDQPLVENQPEQVDQLVVPETISMEEDTNVEMLTKTDPIQTESSHEPRVDLTPNMVGESVQEGFNEQEGGINNMQCDVWQPSMTENCDKIIPQQAEEIIPAQIPEEVAEQKEIQETCSEPSEDNFSEGVHDLPVDEKVCEETSVDIDCDRTNLNSSDLNRTESNSLVMETIEENLISNIEESAEELAAKESVLKALGLQSLKAAEEAKQKTKEKPSGSKSDNYTGTLKTVIKINRDKKKGGRSSIKMTLQKHKIKNVSTEEEPNAAEDNYKVMKEGPSSVWKQTPQSSDTADGSSEHTSDGEAATQDGAIKALVIPEKASSFSIHPGRLCKDECSYCFGKFGLFDTPCHLAQMKSVDRQNKILATEKHLTRDSCLCDACYRHVDRKSNTPSYVNKSLKRNSLVAPGPKQNHCHVLGCNKESSNILRRKWIIKMRKSICQVINIDLDNPGLHSIPICDEHYSALEHLMVCAMCKRRLARNHIHYLGPETIDLNNALNAEGIPLTLTDKPVVCKLCKCFASIILKGPEERPETSENFFREYKRRLLHFNDIVPMDEAAAEEPIAVPSKAERTADYVKKKKKFLKNPLAATTTASESDCPESPEKIHDRVPSTDTSSQPQSRSGSPSDEYNGVDYNTLIPAIAMDCGSDTEGKKDLTVQPVVIRKVTGKIELIRDAVEITKITKSDNNKNSDMAVQKLGANPSISVRQLFQGEEDLPLNVNIDFNNIKERTPEGWEKCNSIIQYDTETKRLWQELQKPYGNQSSFLRHLILLEKYFRNGDLVLSSRASHHSINYSESVHNRLRAYDNIPTSAGNIQPMSMLPFNKMQRSSSGIITSANIATSHNNFTSTNTSTNQPPPSSTPLPNCKPVGNMAMSITTIPPNNTPKSTPLTISQLNSPPLIPANTAVLQQIRPKMVGAPPGLISLHPGTARPIAPLVKVPQPQKIKFPITKNWRPNLIPIDPTKKQEKKTGLVQVISGGKPYHITLEDYKKMCAIKRSFEIKQKRMQEAQSAKPILVTHNSVLKSIIPRKGLIISKTPGVSPIKTEAPPPPPPIPPLAGGEGESILEKLDKQVEKLDSKLNEKQSSSSSLLLPRIPKSLTVIPQTVTRRPSSPVLLITPKSSTNKS